MKFLACRFDPEADNAKPCMQDHDIALEPTHQVLLDVMLRIKQQDGALSLRKSCRQGVYGSDAFNINGRNRLARVTPVRALKAPIVLRLLPSFPVICDLVVDMPRFSKQQSPIKPCLVNDGAAPERERSQSLQESDELNGFYE